MVRHLISMLLFASVLALGQTADEQNAIKKKTVSDAEAKVNEVKKSLAEGLQNIPTGSACKTPDSLHVEPDFNAVTITSVIDRTDSNCPTRTFMATLSDLQMGRGSVDVLEHEGQQLVEIHCLNQKPCFHIDPPFDAKVGGKPTKIEYADNAFLHTTGVENAHRIAANVQQLLARTILLNQIEKADARRFK